jgi:hypothetical protein
MLRAQCEEVHSREMFQLDQPSENRCAASDASRSGASEWRTTQSIKLDLFSAASVAIDGSKFKAVDARDKNFTEARMKRRLSGSMRASPRYLSQLETADRHGDAEVKGGRLKGKIEKLKEDIDRLNAINAEMMKSEDKRISLSEQVARIPASLATTCRLQLIRSVILSWLTT